MRKSVSIIEIKKRNLSDKEKQKKSEYMRNYY